MALDLNPTQARAAIPELLKKKKKNARQSDHLGNVIRRHLARPPLCLPRLVHDIADQVGPTDPIRGRDGLGCDHGAERFADVARVGEVARRGDQDGPETGEVTCSFRVGHEHTHTRTIKRSVSPVSRGVRVVCGLNSPR